MSHLDGLLERVVARSGQVAYQDIRPDVIDESLAEIAQRSQRAHKGPYRYAFLLNAYNVWAIALAARQLHGADEGLTSVWGRILFFALSPIRVAGRWMNLLWLEWVRLKPHLRKDPRGHFALVCASSGCPPLRQGRFTGRHLDDELDAAARAFLRPGRGYRLDRSNEVLHVSRIFRWYRDDFRRMGGVRTVVMRYADPNDVAWMTENVPEIKFMRYDWQLNQAPR